MRERLRKEIFYLLLNFFNHGDSTDRISRTRDMSSQWNQSVSPSDFVDSETVSVSRECEHRGDSTFNLRTPIETTSDYLSEVDRTIERVEYR